MKIWLDDKRPMPVEFDTQLMSAYSVIMLLKTGKVTHIGLDHDLGDEELVGNGHMVADYIEEGAYFGWFPRIIWSIQSSNGPEVTRMSIALRRADVYWGQNEESSENQGT